MQSTPKRVLFCVYGCSLCGAWGAEGEQTMTQTCRKREHGKGTSYDLKNWGTS